MYSSPTFDNPAVIGILFEEGTSNDFIVSFINEVSEEEQNYFSGDMVNIANLLPSGGYYSYNGSLTTPPCSEIVTWVVMKTTA